MHRALERALGTDLVRIQVLGLVVEADYMLLVFGMMLGMSRRERLVSGLALGTYWK